MTMAGVGHGSSKSRLDRLTKDFNKTVKNTRSVLFAERAWPIVTPFLCAGSAFLTASWFGVWEALPHQVRMAGVLALGALSLGAPLWVGLRGKSLLVSKNDAYDRLNHNLGETDTKPAHKVSDSLHASNSNLSKGLFRLNLEKLWDRYEGRFKAGKPDLNWEGLNGWSIAITTIMTLSAAIYAGDNHYEKLTTAFNWEAPIPPLKLTASVTPPKNLGLQPIYLTGEGVQHDTLTAHKQSLLTIHIFDVPSRVFVNEREIDVTKTSRTDTQNIFTRNIILQDGTADIRIENGPQWRFNVNDDLAPQADIRSVQPDTEQPSLLNLEYSVQDDYGVSEGEIIIKAPPTATSENRQLPSSKFPKIVLPH